MKRGLILNVMGSNCTNGGSAKTKRILVYGNGIPEIFEGVNLPAYTIWNRPGSGLILIPEGSHKGEMFSGNFAYTSDSRFSDVCRSMSPGWNGWVLPIFDRDESKPFDSTMYRFVKAEYKVSDVMTEINFAFDFNASVVMLETAVEYLAATKVFGMPEAEIDNDDGSEKGFWLRGDDEEVCVEFRDMQALNYEEYGLMKRVRIGCYSVTEQEVIDWMARRGNKDALVIQQGQGNEAMFWNADAMAWGGKDTASRYTRNDLYRIRPHVMPKTTSGMPSVFVKASSI